MSHRFPHRRLSMLKLGPCSRNVPNTAKRNTVELITRLHLEISLIAFIKRLPNLTLFVAQKHPLPVVYQSSHAKSNRIIKGIKSSSITISPIRNSLRRLAVYSLNSSSSTQSSSFSNSQVCHPGASSNAGHQHVHGHDL